MFEKLLAVASVTALACFGLAFTTGGCSSSDPAGPSTAVDAGSKDAKTSTPPPTGDDDPPAEACGPKGDPATMEALDAEFGWKPPAARQNACTADDIATIKAVTRANSYKDFVAGTSAACQACVLTMEDAPNWGPIVIKNESGSEGLVNFGACFAAVDKPECGKARQYLEICLSAACSACTTAADRQECLRSAAGKQCDAPFGEVQTQCTNADAERQCASLYDGIEHLCAYDAPDAG